MRLSVLLSGLALKTPSARPASFLKLGFPLAQGAGTSPTSTTAAGG